MANNLETGKKTMAVSMLCEGNSIRSIERITGVHRDTIMRLGLRMGEGCKEIMDSKMRG
jgi:transposase-like protein